MKILRRTLVALLAGIFLFLTACAAPAEESISPQPSTSADVSESAAGQVENGAAWINSDISGNVTAQTEVDPKDDFNAAVNRMDGEYRSRDADTGYEFYRTQQRSHDADPGSDPG